jgi:ubiquinone/menaquinone biosynthesis C-methylase UbiE
MSEQDRAGELAKYAAAYQRPGYKMGPERLTNSRRAVSDWALGRGYRHYLDVGAGRGEMLDHAEFFAFQMIAGTEVVAELIQADPRLVYAEAHALPFPDRSSDVVTCFDVLEHLLPQDVKKAVDELFRVARAVVIISAAQDSQFQEGVEHHPSRRPLEKWRSLLTQRAEPFGFRFREARFCRKGSELWVFTGKKAKGAR